MSDLEENQYNTDRVIVVLYLRYKSIFEKR